VNVASRVISSSPDRAAGIVLAVGVQQVFFNSLEALRGIAALVVVFYHAMWTNPLTQLQFVQNGPLMVDFFFVLSGFVICHSYGHRIGSRSELAKFIWLRFGRLYPLHFAFLMVFLAFEVAKWVVERQLGLVADKPAFTVNGPFALLTNLLLIHSLGLHKTLTFNYPSWSISTEFYTYVLFGVLRLALPNERRFMLAVIAVVLSGAAILLAEQQYALVDAGPEWGFFRCSGEFFLGALTYQAYTSLRSRVPQSASLTALMNALPIAIVLAIVGFLSRPLTGAWPFAFPVLAAALILSVVLASGSPMATLLQTRPLRWLGRVSYSVYMVHAALVWSMTQLLSIALHVPRIELKGEHVLVTSPGWGLVLVIAYVCAVLALSELTYQWIEEPFRARSKQLARRWFGHAA